MEKRSKGRPKIYEDKELYNSYGGFELIIALAYHYDAYFIKYFLGGESISLIKL